MRVGPAILAAVLLLGSAATLKAATWPNDPAWGHEWGPVVTHTEDVWRHGTGSSRVVIAVVDTGVVPVADLQGALVPGVDLVGGGVSQGGPGEPGFHGTWVASIVAGRGNNGIAGAGYCWQCSIMPVRVSDGVHPADSTRVAEGIRWAVDHGAAVVNVSLAGATRDEDEADAVAFAAEQGVVVVASAGNAGDDSLRYPAAYPSVLAVAGTDQDDRLYPWSSRGSWVELAAPGCGVLSDPLVGAAHGCGSSFAPAAVSGIVGLLLSFDKSLSADRVVAALRSSTHPVEGIGGGRVDAAAAFAALALPNVANVSSPASAQSAPATTAASPREATIGNGSLVGSRSFAFRTGAGRLVVRVVTPAAAQCQLRVALGTETLVELADQGVLGLDTTVRAGVKRLTIACASRRLVDYRLEIDRSLPG